MSLTRFLPIPSDRMGILWTLLSIKDAIVLEYSPAGTTSYVKKAYGAMGIEIEERLHATTMSKDDVVMGDTSLLEKEIKRLDTLLNPSVIFVMASTVSNVIGTDVKGVCHCIEDEVSAKLVVFTQGGFSADYSSGRKAAFTEIIKNFATKEIQKDNTYNVLGVSQVVHSSQKDIESIKQMMKENFDLEENVVLSYDTTIENINKMSKSKINLVLSYEALEAAKTLKQRFNTPYVYKFPIGNDTKWLNEIATNLNQNIKEENITKQDKLSQVKAVIYTSYDRGVSLAKYLEEIGVEEVKVITTHRINSIRDKYENVEYLKDESTRLKYFKSLDNTLVFGDNIISTNINETNTHVNIENLFLDTYQTEFSLIGKQAQDMIENICNNHIENIKVIELV